MSLRRSGFRKDKKPLTPLQEYKRSAPLAIETPRDEQINTAELEQKKVHPIRDEKYRAWLYDKPCCIEGRTNKRTGLLHVCWSPERIGRQFKSDPMHGRKLGTAIKADDSSCFPGCRHCHREQEANMDRFDADYDIDRHQIAAGYYAEYQREQELKR
jgi:hypothetical protein